jgi:hypothetical protein
MKIRVMPILLAAGLVVPAIASIQDQPNEDKVHQREELGVNSYTAPRQP